jgi:hypothetical protein
VHRSSRDGKIASSAERAHAIGQYVRAADRTYSEFVKKEDEKKRMNGLVETLKSFKHFKNPTEF